MINSVRSEVLSILNKDNYGYVTPSDFNLYARQAQLDIFLSYFDGYNEQINKENARISGVDYADLRKAIEENIDVFSVTNPLLHDASNRYKLPSLLTTGDQAHMITKIVVYNTLVASGQTDLLGSANECIDTGADFIADGVEVNDLVAILVSGVVTYVEVLTVAETILTTTGTLWTINPTDYSVYKTSQKEAEKVSNSRILNLSNSILTSPKEDFPAYTQEASLASLYPKTINTEGRVIAQYLRYPNNPKWTFVELVNGEAMFDQSQPDYMDFELPVEAENLLVMKILQYAGMSIREIATVQFGQAKEKTEEKK